MELTLGLKDIIYISVYVVTIASLIFGFRGRIKRLEERMGTHNSTLFKKDASLNLVTTEVCKEHRVTGEKNCKEHRDEVTKILDKSALVVKEVFDKLEKVNINIVKIATHMKVDVDE